MMEIKAILFDVIGTTILEARSSIVTESFKKAFAQHNLQVTDSEVEAVRGKDKHEAIRILLEKMKITSSFPSSILEAFKTNLRESLHHFSEAEDLHDIISWIRSRKIYVGVGSGLPADLFQILFNHFNWARFNFDYIGVAENIGRGRPHPDMIEDMCRKLKVDKCSFLKVGDTPSDIEEGKNANVYTAAILRGTVPDHLLHDAKPDFAIHALSEVKGIVEVNG